MYAGKRFWEVDFLRGTAVLLMVFYHFAFDLSYFKNFLVFQGEWFWFYFPRAIAAIFLFLLGVSLALKNISKPNLEFKDYLKRGAWIFFLGMVLTVITYIFVKNIYIIFGILHFAGIATILGYFFLKQGRKNLVYGAIIIAAGLYLGTMTFNFPYLLWLGFIPEGFRTLDYFPLLPWFGVVLFGIFFGEYFYSGYKRKIEIGDISRVPGISLFCFMGRHSLLIYFLHQPIIFLIIWLTGGPLI